MADSAQPTIITVHSQRLDALTAEAQARTWKTVLAITGQQPVDAPKSTEALVAALATCVISGIQRESTAAGLQVDDVRVSASGTRVMNGNGPLLTNLKVDVLVTSPEPEEKLHPILEALDHNGTVTNTLKLGQSIEIHYQIVAAAEEKMQSIG
jgi:uncharacterized OsmC-like protein